MSRLDIVIFGATGFTGKHVAIECAKISKRSPNKPLTWGIAGRSQSKLNDVLEEASKKSGENLSSIPVMIADVADDASLQAMCQRAKVVVNCCGPYMFFGEPVVRAAVQNGAHYVDVSGEPEFIELMELHYDKAARDAGVYIISACGFDSIPADLGVIFVKQNFEGTLNSVESYLTGSLPSEYRKLARKGGVINYGTWATVVHSMAHEKELKPLGKQLFPERLPTFKPKLAKKGLLHRRDGRWCAPFGGSDASIVRRTQRSLLAGGERPLQFGAYVYLPGFWVIPLLFLGTLIMMLGRCGLGRRLLLKHPRFFSGGFISRGEVHPLVMDNTSFSFTLHGQGWAPGEDINKTKPKKTLTARVSGVNPGYGATVVALLQSAFTILEESDKIPETGGVLTTGYAFKDTSLIKRLHDNGLKFEIISSL